jgi:hypothetical protein
MFYLLFVDAVLFGVAILTFGRNSDIHPRETSETVMELCSMHRQAPHSPTWGRVAQFNEFLIGVFSQSELLTV